MDAALNPLFSSPIRHVSLFALLFIIGMAITLMIRHRRQMNNPQES